MDSESGLGQELDRRFAVLDMMLSAHAVLRARSRSRGMMLDLLILALSTALLCTTWLDPALLPQLAMSAETSRAVQGGLSALVFFLSLVQLLVDWKARAVSHGRARDVIADLKSTCRGHQLRLAQGDDSGVREWLERADILLTGLEPIPDGQFAELKAAHWRKVELSRLISRHPGTPLIALKLYLAARDTKKLLLRQDNND